MEWELKKPIPPIALFGAFNLKRNGAIDELDRLLEFLDNSLVTNRAEFHLNQT